MTFNIVTLINAAQGSSECVASCSAAITAGRVTEMPHPGAALPVAVRDIIGTWRIRQATVRSAGLPNCGFEETLKNLESQSPAEVLQTFVFRGERDIYTVFVRMSDESVIGCIWIQRNSDSPV